MQFEGQKSPSRSNELKKLSNHNEILKVEHYFNNDELKRAGKR